MAARNGFRGYMSTRAVRGSVTPQRVQNLVIRDYAARHGLSHLMNVSEFAMPGCYMILENALRELDRTLGIIAFSAFMLPPERDARQAILRRVLDAGASFHAALENISVRSEDDVAGVEDLISSVLLLDSVPLRGRYEKNEHPISNADDPFINALRASI